MEDDDLQCLLVSAVAIRQPLTSVFLEIAKIFFYLYHLICICLLKFWRDNNVLIILTFTENIELAFIKIEASSSNGSCYVFHV